MQNNVLRLAAFGLGVLLSVPAFADTAAEIKAINERINVMTAQLAQMELEAKLQAKSGELGRMRSGTATPDEIPSVRAIEGFRSHLTATLVFSRGDTINAEVGDVLPNGFAVTGIYVNRVVLKKGKVEKVLTFGVASQAPATPVPGAAVGTPVPVAMPPQPPGAR